MSFFRASVTPRMASGGGHLQSGLEVGLLVPNSGLVVNEDIIDEGWTGAVVLWRLELELAIQD